MSAAGLTDPAWLELPAAERSKTFQAKPVWQRAIVVAAGPVTNFLLAFLILMGFALAYGENRTPAAVGAVEKGSAAQSIGLQPGDRIVSIGGRSMDTFNDLFFYVQGRAGQQVRIEFDRSGTTMARDVVIGRAHEKDEYGNEADIGRLGIAPPKPIFVRIGLLEAPRVAWHELGNLLRVTGEGLGQLVSGQRPVKDMSGVVGMAKISSEQLNLGFAPFLWMVALISINLGFINLLPVPMLDGGHLLFYAIEAVRRRPVTPQIQEWAFRGGLVAILALFVVVTYNDLDKVGLWRHLAGLIG
jgi:regulator of sigma E protease